MAIKFKHVIIGVTLLGYRGWKIKLEHVCNSVSIIFFIGKKRDAPSYLRYIKIHYNCCYR